ncbi:MAG: cysteine hydrolase [Candidatus Hodarchaeales archaeon]|jgi:nicotinamidase-related amidase
MKDSKTIVEAWRNIKPPSPPELKKVEVKPEITALLVLDIQNQNCNEERRPRCIESIPKIKNLLTEARLKGMLVIYSLIRSSNEQDIREEVKPQRKEPIVKSGVDKFYKTDLEEILYEKGIKRVIIVGTSANGAVLHTVTGAALRQLEVIVPIDGLSAGELYTEQYTIWHLVNAPGTRRNVVLTKVEWIKIT